MGNRLNRSEEHHEEHKSKKDKHRRRRRRHEKVDDTFDGDSYLIHRSNENESPNGNFNVQFDAWKNEYNQSQFLSMNDAPGAPSTYSTNDIMAQPWATHQNMTNSFYPMNPVQMTPPFNISYPSNQHYNPQTIVPEVRTSKKVQFSSIEHIDSPVTKLTRTTDDSCIPASTRPKKLITKTSSVPLTIEKPIYVGIDYQATLAERSQTVKRHRQTTEKQSSHRTRTHKHQLLTDSPQSNSSLTKTQRKSSPIIPHRQNIEHMPIIASDSKPTKVRTHRRPQQEQQHMSSPLIHEAKPIKVHRQTQPNQSLSSISSTITTTTTTTTKPRFEMKQNGSPVMRISLSQLNQQHSKHRVTRTRI